MKDPICKEKLPSLHPTDTEAKDLHSWYIANCVLNALLTITAILFNSVTIQALRRTSSLPKPLKTLLLSLAVSDLGVGLLVEPFFFGLLVSLIQGNDLTGATCIAYLIISNLISVPSLLGVMALSVDRFLAIHLHLRYQELVTHKRVVAAVISIWVFSLSYSLFRWLGSSVSSVLFFSIALLFIACFVFSAVLYFKIYSAVRRHRNQIHALQVQQVAGNDEMTNFARLRKSALGTFYVYLLFLLCYLPSACTFFVVAISGLTTGVKAFSVCSTTLMLLNSSLNPVIYCWKMRHIRHAIMDILRNIFPNHN
ncbi:adenosine receptor A3-like [Oculina patagonica]